MMLGLLTALVCDNFSWKNHSAHREEDTNWSEKGRQGYPLGKDIVSKRQQPFISMHIATLQQSFLNVIVMEEELVDYSTDSMDSMLIWTDDPPHYLAELSLVNP